MLRASLKVWNSCKRGWLVLHKFLYPHWTGDQHFPQKVSAWTNQSIYTGCHIATIPVFWVIVSYFSQYWEYTARYMLDLLSPDPWADLQPQNQGIWYFWRPLLGILFRRCWIFSREECIWWNPGLLLPQTSCTSWSNQSSLLRVGRRREK